MKVQAISVPTKKRFTTPVADRTVLLQWGYTKTAAFSVPTLSSRSTYKFQALACMNLVNSQNKYWSTAKDYWLK